MMEKCLIDKTWLIEYNQIRSRDRVSELIKNKKKIDIQV